jgi:chitin disaccharide deacetylase
VKNLIVNADDLGWTEGVNRGIAEAHRNGIVTSASLLANGPAFREAVELARTMPRLGVGVHLNLSDGKPVTGPDSVPSLVNRAGEFAGGPERLLLKMGGRLPGAPTLSDVEKEWGAQIRTIFDAGITPTHLDGHKHVHMLPWLFEIAVRLANKHGIGAIRVSHENGRLRTALSSGADRNGMLVVRQGMMAHALRLLARNARRQARFFKISTADYFCGITQTGALTKEGVLRLLQRLPEGTTELMCHPGYADEGLRRTATRLQESRQKEIEILTDPELRNVVASRAIRLIDYGSVAHQA